MFDVVIVGGGAAGLSAALVLGRARRHVLVIDDGQPRNAAAHESHGFFTRDGERPSALLRIAREQLAAYPTVELYAGSVSDISRADGGFVLTLRTELSFSAKKVLLATGVVDRLPDIPGLRERWGKSVFVCPFCDGWEVRDERIAVYGPGRDAVEIAQELFGWSKDLLICIERDDLTEADRRWIVAAQVSLVAGKLRSISGDCEPTLTLHDGSTYNCRALFISAPLRQHSPLFAKIGCALDADGEIVIDKHGRTTVDGCYAAGDSVTSRHQVVIAAASGASAAITLNCNLLEEEARQLTADQDRTELAI